jgi:hypothetical protein
VSAREQAIEAGARAVRDGMPAVSYITDNRPYRPEIGMYASWNEYDFARAVLDAVEPIIRADERDAVLGRFGAFKDHIEAEVRERIAQEIEADHATGPLCKAFGGGANVCTHGRDAAIARGAS